MKGKAEIINELEKLTVIKDELTQEVSRLHGLLEQERSKVAALSNEKQLHKVISIFLIKKIYTFIDIILNILEDWKEALNVIYTTGKHIIGNI